MRRTNTKRAIRHAFYRLGLHTRPETVAHALREQGVQVTEELIRQVRFEIGADCDPALLLQLCLEYAQHGAHDFVYLRGLPLGLRHSG